MLSLLIASVLYCLPTIIALLRGHQDSVLILLVNLILGWTIIFWVLSLVLSLTSTKKQEKYIIINNVTKDKE